MSPELRELFEIKQDGDKKALPSNQNVTRHILIRLAVLISGTIVFSIAMTEAKGWDGLAYLIFMMIFHGLWFLFIIIETTVLQSKNKLKLRNINLIFAGSILLLYGIAAALFFGGS
ncbi:hypothetical protein C1631_003680 [Chryseobacterium phosphatilyticum]|uniref:Uncharacterized protein n=1 Tax=Chryseobacterium phosphatilyticum TaxID=475075 RepID=A0A316XDX4_9FLAO|nr:hypothetical protein [Chryseobacterium phosphatilyticum]PWN71734.1 hypothetical protein C1631_003680 [Chryseobacterium phosphatilyticum]